MNFITELQRRKVFKVGAAYLVVAWVLIQVVATLAPQFQLPDWAPRLVTLILLIGFPIALVMAWVFDITPEGVKLDAGPTGSKRLFAVAIVLIALALGWYFHGQPAFRKGDAATPAHVAAMPATPVVDPHSIAVLPFVNMSADPAQEFFSDGISEELLNRLAQFHDLKVAARTSAFQFKGKNLDIADIGRRLKVSHVLEGSVRKQGARLRITAQLIDSTSGFHLWSETYERDASDVFEVQDEISTAIANALEARISGRPIATSTPQSANPAAYDDYLLARSLVARRVGDNLPLAIAAFDRAIAKDPSYSPAHSGRAFAYAIAPGWSGLVKVETAFPKALAGADEALRLDPGNAEAYMVRGSVRSIEFQEVAARIDFDHALALAPGNVDIVNFAGDNYQFTGNLRAAERMKRQAMALDPLTFIHPTNLASILTAQGRFRESLAASGRALELGAGYVADQEKFWAQLRLGELDAARTTVATFCAELGMEKTKCLIDQLALSATMGDRHAVERWSAALSAREKHWAEDSVYSSDIASVYANDVKDIAKATIAMRQSLGHYDYNTTIVLLLGPRGARLPEEISQDPGWLAIWNDPRLRETMVAYRKNLLAFRKGE